MPKINVNHAQEDNFQTKQELTALYKTSTPTMDSTISNVQVTKSEVHGRAAMLVDLAKLELSQMLPELLVLLQDQFAAALKSLMPKINVNHAQEDNSQTNQDQTASFKTSTPTMDLTISNVQVTKSEVHGRAALLVEAAQLELTQMLLELIASDHKQFATVFKDNQLMDSHALTVVIDKLLTQPTVNNVLQHQHALETTNISELVMLQAATNAEPVLQDSLLLKIELHAIDQDQLATVSKDTLQMDTNAKTAKLVSSKTLWEIQNVLLLQLVITTSIEELVMLQPVTDAKPVLYHLLWTSRELDALDQDQSATASKDTQLTTINALTAQLVKLSTQPTTNSVLLPQHVLDQANTQDLAMLKTATNAEPVLQDSL